MYSRCKEGFPDLTSQSVKLEGGHGWKRPEGDGEFFEKCQRWERAKTESFAWQMELELS